MNDRWRRIEDLFHEASLRPSAERERWLAAVCDDPEIRREVLNLLASDDRAGSSFVEQQVGSALQTFAATVPRPALERRVGAYRLIREVGRGGMGTVYEAEHEERQGSPVAVKVVRRGLDTDFFLMRFRRERQTLARLHHPNIARLLDHGITVEEAPYLVMEFIDGVPVTDYCRAHSLSPSEKLRLFLPICAAVSHAHQHFVVHRDIKPGNILVDRSGSPKLLDFGICKLLYSGQPTEMTVAGSGPMLTPDYASPEQVLGEPVTVASDIYSLGAVLYELLTGEKPHRFEKTTPQAVERTICETPLTPPSRRTADPHVARRLKGDIDNIVLCAMQREPDRRYASVEQFAADIVRHLEDQPIQARHDTIRYRATKFLRRNRRGLSAAIAAGVLLSWSGASALYYADRSERHIAITRGLAADSVAAVRQSMAGSIRDAAAGLGVRTLAAVATAAAADTEVRRTLLFPEPVMPLSASRQESDFAVQSASLLRTVRTERILSSELAWSEAAAGAGLAAVNPAEARNALQRASAIAADVPPPETTRTCRLIGQAYERLGDRGAAREWYRRSLAAWNEVSRSRTLSSEDAAEYRAVTADAARVSP